MQLIAFPQSFMAGTTFDVVRSYASYPSNDGWSSTVEISNADNKYSITSTGVSTSSYNYVSETGVTATYEIGDYGYSVIVIKSGDAFVAENGDMEITADLIHGGAADTRTNAEKILDSINTLLEGKFLSDKDSYSIAGRSLKTMSISELMSARQDYQSIVNQERGKGFRPVVQVFRNNV